MSVPQKSSFLTLLLKFLAAVFCDSKRKFLVPANIIYSVFPSAKCFGTKFRKIPSCFLFREMVQNEFREFASIFVPRYGIPSIFLFCGMVRTEFREFSVLWNSRNFLSEQTICFVYSVFQGFFFVGNSQPCLRVFTAVELRAYAL